MSAVTCTLKRVPSCTASAPTLLGALRKLSRMANGLDSRYILDAAVVIYLRKCAYRQARYGSRIPKHQQGVVEIVYTE